jgi:hypothetical protein
MKFVENPRHIFECTTPPHPGEIIHYRHPTYPLYCDNLGILYLDNENWEISFSTKGTVNVSKMYDKTTTQEKFMAVFGADKTVGASKAIAIGPRERVVYECYYQRVADKEHVNYVNHNPWDLRKENLFTTYEVPAKYHYRHEWKKDRLAFLDESAKQINKRIVKLHAIGYNPYEYLRIMLRLPNLVITHWNKHKEKFGLEPGILDHWGNL